MDILEDISKAIKNKISKEDTHIVNKLFKFLLPFGPSLFAIGYNFDSVTSMITAVKLIRAESTDSCLCIIELVLFAVDSNPFIAAEDIAEV